MPTYEYRCPAGHDFEKFYRKISDAGSEVPCPQCGQIGMRKISAGAGLVFKGSGFYITDYGKDGKKDQRTAGTAKGSSEGGGSESTASSPASAGESKASSGKSGGDASSGGESKAAPPAPAKESKAPPSPASKPGKSSGE